MWLCWKINLFIHFIGWNAAYEWYMYNNYIHEDLPSNQFSCLRSKRKDLAGSKNESNVCNIMMTMFSHSLVFIEVSDSRECCGGGGGMHVCVCGIVSGRNSFVLLTLTAARPEIRESVCVGWGWQPFGGRLLSEHQTKVKHNESEIKKSRPKTTLLSQRLKQQESPKIYSSGTGKSVEGFLRTAPTCTTFYTKTCS